MRTTNIRRVSIFAILVAAILCEANCAGKTSTPAGNPAPPNNPAPPSVTVSVSPNPISLRAGSSQTFAAAVSGSSNQSVAWQVNGVTGGAASTGLINSSGAYTAPAIVPSPNTVTVQAVSAADSSVAGQSSVTLLNPVPALNGIVPTSVTSGSFAITVTGSGFVNGAQVLLAGSALSTAFVSSTQLTASGTASTAGTFAVTVTNPNPGSSSSGAQDLQVTSASSGGPPPPPPPACSVMSAGQGGSLNGFVPFPSGSLWNQDISSAPVDPNSAALISFIGTSIGLHPDFGSGEYNGSIIGIPYEVVDATQGPVSVNFTAYGDESDRPRADADSAERPDRGRSEPERRSARARAR
jgi:hypothetical protein